MKLKTTRNLFSLALTLSIVGCTFNTPVTLTSNSTVNSIIQKNEYIIKVDNKKGASLSFEINFRKLFSIKSSQGSYATPESVIKSYKVYLIKSNTSSFPSGGDPLNPANIVGTPVLINATNISNPVIKFDNVPESTTLFGSGEYYYVAVRAYDNVNGTGNELIKDNNNGTAWSGTTTLTPKVAVSTGAGIQVRSGDYAVSSTFSLPLTIYTTVRDNPAIVDTRIRFSDGSRISSYKLNLCTNPNEPLTTKVMASPVTISRTTSSNYELASFKDIPPGTYYAFIEGGFSNSDPFTNIISKNNGGTPYSNLDIDARVSVSSNSMTLNSTQQFTFSNLSTAFEISVNIESNVTPDLVNHMIIAGNSSGVAPTTNNQIATNVKLGTPSGVATDSSGNIYIADSNNNLRHYIEKIDTNGNLKIIAGNSSGSVPTYTPVPATSVLLPDPFGITVDSVGNIYITDFNRGYIEKIDTNGNLKIIAGKTSGSAASTSPQAATDVNLVYPIGLATDASGNLYIADFLGDYIEKVDTNGNLKIIAGNTSGSNPTTSNQVATSVKLNNPEGIAIDSNGNIYITDSGNNYIEKIDTNGNLRIIAGKAGGSPPNINKQIATNVKLASPFGIAVDADGNVYINDRDNNFIEKIDANGSLKIVVGNASGANPSTTTQPATSVKLNYPQGIAMDSNGNLYIADSNNSFIEKVTQ